MRQPSEKYVAGVTRFLQQNPVMAVRFAADLMSRSGFASAQGLLSFNGNRDVSRALGYALNITPEEYLFRYERNGLAARVVECKPEATWVDEMELVEDEDPDVLTQFEEIWNELESRLHVTAAFQKLDILAGVGCYGVLFLGLPGTDLSVPAPDRYRPEDIVYLVPYSEVKAPIVAYETDPSNERYGLPTIYELSLVGTSGRTKKTRVHHSRVLHIADGKLDSRYLGQPRLKRVWNDFDNADKVLGAGAEAYWQRANPGLFGTVAADTVLKPEDAEELDQQMDEYIHQQRKQILARGVEFDLKGSNVSDFSNPLDAIITVIAGSTGIPKRILVGSEMGELASTQDASNWEKKIALRRTQYAEPEVIRPFVQKLIDAGALPDVEYQVRWPERQTMDDNQRADVAVKLAGLNDAAGELVITGQEIRDRILKLPRLEEATDEKQRQVYTGIQLQAAMALMTQVSSGAIDRDAAIAMLELMFNIPTADAAKLIAEPEEVTVEPLSLPPAPGDGQSEVDVPPQEQTQQNAQRAAASKTLAQVRRDQAKNLQREFARAARLARKEKTVDKMIQTLERKLQDSMEARLLSCLVQSAQQEASRSRATRGRTRAAELKVAKTKLVFNKRNPEAERWAKTRSSKFVVEVSSDTREGIRQAISDGFAKGLTAGQTARRVRSLVGLTSKDAAAVANFRSRLEDADNARVTALSGRLVVDVPEGGLSDARIDSYTERYSDELLDIRADTIARTETIAASSEGQRELWAQGVEEGFFDPTDERVWIVADDERLCPVCSGLDGQSVGLQDQFRTEDGEELDGPPAHPNCRCAQGLVPAELARAAEGVGSRPKGQSREADFNEDDHPRDEKGQFTSDGGGGGGLSEHGTAMVQAMNSAPLTEQGAGAWRKEHQKLYDSNPEFRALADVTTVYTQGAYSDVYAATVKVDSGDWHDGATPFIKEEFESAIGSHGDEVKTMFKGQDFDNPDRQGATWADGAKALNAAIEHSTPIDSELHRGVMGRDAYNAFEKFEAGSEFHIAGATSFTMDSEIAEKFASGRGPGQYKDLNAPRTIIKIKSGGRGLRVAALSPYKQREVIAKGRYRVVFNHAGLSSDRLAEQRTILLEEIK